ncbi:MAG: GNAT family N-acetyltransferase, partial [Candidatus Aenigmatarchaeota archaeon]
DYVRYESALVERGYNADVSVSRFVLDLREGWENIKRRMDSSRRRGIENAVNKGKVEVYEEELTEENIRKFYDDYVRLVRKLGEPHAYPLSFFTELSEAMPDGLSLFHAVDDEEDLGWHLCISDSSRSTFINYLNGIGPEGHRNRSSEILYRKSIMWAIENDYRYFDFYGTPSDFADGDFRFKERFGGEVRPMLQWSKTYSRTWSLVSRIWRRVVESAGLVEIEGTG